MISFTIKDIENLSGIKAHTIRIWEQRYSFLKPLRSNTNIRFYSEAELKIILDVSLLNKYDFKISRINQMTVQEIQNTIENLPQLQAQYDAIINKLFFALFNLDADELDNVLNTYIQANGIFKAVENIIYPFMKKTEVLHFERHLKSEYQHILTNIIRQKLIVAIEQQHLEPKNDKVILGFLPEGNYYEMELLFMQYLLRKQGLSVIYVGTNVPVSDIIKIAVYKKPDYIYTHLNAATRNFNTDKFLNRLSALFNEFKIVITGSKLINYKKKVPQNIQLKFSMSEAVDYMA